MTDCFTKYGMFRFSPFSPFNFFTGSTFKQTAVCSAVHIHAVLVGQRKNASGL